MKRVVPLLLLGLNAHADMTGEWKEIGRNAYLHILPSYFIFRECGRYRVVAKSPDTLNLFTGRENNPDCLPRGENECTYEVSQDQLTLNCVLWTRTYQRAE